MPLLLTYKWCHPPIVVYQTALRPCVANLADSDSTGQLIDGYLGFLLLRLMQTSTLYDAHEADASNTQPSLMFVGS